MAVPPDTWAATEAFWNWLKQEVKLALVNGAASAVASFVVFTTVVCESAMVVGVAALAKVGESPAAVWSVWARLPNRPPMNASGIPRHPANWLTALVCERCWAGVRLEPIGGTLPEAGG